MDIDTFFEVLSYISNGLFVFLWIPQIVNAFKLRTLGNFNVIGAIINAIGGSGLIAFSIYKNLKSIWIVSCSEKSM